MWGGRSRSRIADDRYESKMLDRLRGVAEVRGATTDAVAVRERLERMRHGASRQSAVDQ